MGEYLESFNLEKASKVPLRFNNNFTGNFFYRDGIIAVDIYSANIPPDQDTIDRIKVSLKQFQQKWRAQEMCAFLRWDETSDPNEWPDILYQIALDLKLLNKNQQLVVYQSLSKPYQNKPYIDLRCCPYFLIICWLTQQVLGTQVQWNPHTQQALYMPGKLANKKHRLVLLKKIFENPSRANTFEVSLLYDSIVRDATTVETINHMMTEYDPHWNNFVEWASNVKHTIDIKQVTGYPPFPVSKLLEKSLLAVTETWQELPYFITEKTYNPLCYGMPFIVCGDLFVDQLNRMGFQTYQQLLPQPDNYRAIDYSQGVDRDILNYETDQLLNNTAVFLSWSKHDPQFVQKVHEVIEYNKQHAQDIVLSYKSEYNRYLGLVLNHAVYSHNQYKDSTSSTTGCLSIS